MSRDFSSSGTRWLTRTTISVAPLLTARRLPLSTTATTPPSATPVTGFAVGPPSASARAAAAAALSCTETAMSTAFSPLAR